MIEVLEDEDGSWVHDSDGLKYMTVEYYSGLFKADASIGIDFIAGAFPRIETCLCEELEKEHSMEETQVSLRGMRSYKSPGPDGVQAIFFKRTWHMIGRTVHSFVRRILEGEEIHEEATEAILVLIPNELQPSTMPGFRPLSLCNAVYKLASKIFMNRLTEVWKSLISPYQESFYTSSVEY